MVTDGSETGSDRLFYYNINCRKIQLLRRKKTFVAQNISNKRFVKVGSGDTAPVVVHANENLHQVLNKFEETKSWNLPVNEGVYVGFFVQVDHSHTLSQ